MSAILLRPAHGRMASGGTVVLEAYVDGRQVGWVGDGRPWLGSKFGGRRWWACHREDGDENARWTSELLGSRAAAIDALHERLRP